MPLVRLLLCCWAMQEGDVAALLALADLGGLDACANSLQAKTKMFLNHLSIVKLHADAIIHSIHILLYTISEKRVLD